MASQVELVVKNPLAKAGDVRDVSSIPGSRRSPLGGHGNPLQYSCLENPMDRVAWWATVHRNTTEATSHIIPIVQIQRYEIIVTGVFFFSFCFSFCFSFYGINVNSYHKDNKIIYCIIQLHLLNVNNIIQVVNISYLTTPKMLTFSFHNLFFN